MSAPSVVLFDAPGPKARARHQIFAIVGTAAAVALLAFFVLKFQQAGQLDPALWTPFLTVTAWKDYLLIGLWATIQAAVLSISLAGIFGLIFGIGRLSLSKPVRWLSGVVVEFFRSVPVLIMMLFLGNGLYRQLTFIPDSVVPLAAVVTALMLYNGAVIAELVRSGVRGLPKGQGEAGLSIGLTTGQTLRLVQLPQAIRQMLPAVVSQFVVALKDSALGFAILYPELLTWAKTLGSRYSNIVPAYLVAAALFIILNYAITTGATKLEHRLSRSGSQPLPLEEPESTTVAIVAGAHITDAERPHL